jgi:hypothetical protein
MKTFLLSLLALALAGCSAQADVPLDRVPANQTRAPMFFIDPDTGCHYWLYGHATPRLTADGKQLCVL